MNPFSNCKSCKKGIAWLKTTDGKSIPVDYDSLSDADRHELNRGMKVTFNKERHITHFVTCPNADKHRNPRPKVDKAPVIYE